MKVRQAYYLGLVLMLLLGLVAGGFLSSSMAAPGGGPLGLGPGSGPSGTLTGCLGSADSSASLSLAGRVITPNTLLRLSPTGTCDPAEQNLNLFSYATTVLVSAGPNAVTNGTNLLASLNAVHNLGPSVNKPFLLKLEPGVYDIGTTSLVMVPYVQIEGSGEDATKITGAGQNDPNTGVISATNSSGLRSLTVESRLGAGYSTGVYANGVDNSFHINQVTLLVKGGSIFSFGIDSVAASPDIENSRIIVSNPNGWGYGSRNVSSVAQIKNTYFQVEVNGSSQAYGVINFNSNTIMKDDELFVSTIGTTSNTTRPDAVDIYNEGGSPVLQNSKLTAVTNGSGVGTGVYNTANTHALIQDTNLILYTGIDGGDGIFMDGTSTNVTVENSNLSVSATGANFAQGFLVNSGSISSTLTVRNTTTTVLANNKANCQVYGVNTFGTPSFFYNSNFIVSVGTGCALAYGLVQQGTPGVISFNNGSVKSTNYAIFNSTPNSVKVGASQLDAPNLTLGPAVCVNSFKSDYTPATATCN